MAVYGLTGGIGTGKSTVCKLFQEQGIPVIGADEVGRQVVAPGSAGLAAIVAAFGADILNAAGALDRAKLGALVFSDPAKRRQLEEIMHPLVKQHSQAMFAELTQSGVPIVVYESALLFETDRHHEMQGVIVVTASEEQRVQRVRQRDNASEEQVRARMKAQMDDSQKLQRADYVLENSGTLEQLRQQVLSLVAVLRQTQNVAS